MSQGDPRLRVRSFQTASDRDLHCEVCHGRQECLKAIVDYVSGPSRLPMIVYGPSGCGKTSVMAKVVESVALWAQSAAEKTGAPVKRVVTVVRFLGTTAMTSNVRDLLESLCRQLIAVYTSGYVDHFFIHLLHLANEVMFAPGIATGAQGSTYISTRVTGIVELRRKGRKKVQGQDRSETDLSAFLLSEFAKFQISGDVYGRAKSVFRSFWGHLPVIPHQGPCSDPALHWDFCFWDLLAGFVPNLEILATL